jgi:hypothetical protein
LATVRSRILADPVAARVPIVTAHALLLKPWFVFGVFAAVNFLLVAVDLLLLGLEQLHGSEQVRRVFHSDHEQSVPTWLSTVQLLIAALLVASIAWIHKLRQAPFLWYWVFLGAVVLGMSIEEVAAIHEHSSLLLTRLGLSGDWVILGAAMAFIVGLAFVPFLLALPRRIAILFVVAGGVTLMGALGVETVHLTQRNSDSTAVLGVIAAIEELLERIGISILILGLLLYMRDYLGVRGIALK